VGSEQDPKPRLQPAVNLHLALDKHPANLMPKREIRSICRKGWDSLKGGKGSLEGWWWSLPGLEERVGAGGRRKEQLCQEVDRLHRGWRELGASQGCRGLVQLAWLQSAGEWEDGRGGGSVSWVVAGSPHRSRVANSTILIFGKVGHHCVPPAERWEA